MLILGQPERCRPAGDDPSLVQISPVLRGAKESKLLEGVIPDTKPEIMQEVVVSQNKGTPI